MKSIEITLKSTEITLIQPKLTCDDSGLTIVLIFQLTFVKSPKPKSRGLGRGCHLCTDIQVDTVTFELLKLLFPN